MKTLAISILIILGVIWFSLPKIDERAMFIHFEPENATTSLVEPTNSTQIHRITCYLWTGNKMANGEYPKKGYVATSDRTIPFGTEIEIDGETFIVGDRTNSRFQYFETPTIDIFWEGSRESCLEFGVQYGFVKILE